MQEALSQLRTLLFGGSDSDDQDLVRFISRLKLEEYRECVKAHNWEEPCLSICKAASDLPNDHELYLPPLYPSDELKKLIVSTMCMASASHTSCLGDGGNICLCGVVGVGKTTLLKIVALCITVLLPDVLPVEWSYAECSNMDDVPTPW